MAFEKDYKKIGKRLKECRVKKGLSQADLAEKIGVTSVSLGKIERGENSKGGSVDEYIDLAVALGISLDDLFEIESYKEIVDDQGKYDVIKSFIELVKPEFENKKYAETDAFLRLSDDGVVYFIQRYMEILNEIDNFKAKAEKKAKIKKFLIDELDEEMSEYTEFDGQSIKIKPDKYYHLEFDNQECQLVIKENDIPF